MQGSRTKRLFWGEHGKGMNNPWKREPEERGIVLPASLVREREKIMRKRDMPKNQ